jgi:phage-related protein
MVGIRNYITASGRDPVREFLAEMSEEGRYEAITLLRRMESGEKISMPLARSLGSIAHGLWELRIRDAQGHFRLFYYTKISGVIYFVHAARKKTRVISPKDRKLILHRIRELNRSRGAHEVA